MPRTKRISDEGLVSLVRLDHRAVFLLQGIGYRFKKVIEKYQPVTRQIKNPKIEFESLGMRSIEDVLDLGYRVLTGFTVRLPKPSSL